MIRTHHVTIRKARRFERAVRVLQGRGLWVVRCRCGLEVTTRSHDQAVAKACHHLALWAGLLSPEATARIRAEVMAYAERLRCGNPPGRRRQLDAQPGSESCGNPTT